MVTRWLVKWPWIRPSVELVMSNVYSGKLHCLMLKRYVRARLLGRSLIVVWLYSFRRNMLLSPSLSLQGIRFRGYSIPELQQKLPTFKGPAGQGEPTPEALVWLLLTDQIPTKEQVCSSHHLHTTPLVLSYHIVTISLPNMSMACLSVYETYIRWQADSLSAELYKRSEIPKDVVALLKSLPKDLHPMSQLVIGLTALQKGSKFAAAYHAGVHKKEYWKHTLEDILDVWAKLPEVGR